MRGRVGPQWAVPLEGKSLLGLSHLLDSALPRLSVPKTPLSDYDGTASLKRLRWNSTISSQARAGCGRTVVLRICWSRLRIVSVRRHAFRQAASSSIVAGSAPWFRDGRTPHVLRAEPVSGGGRFDSSLAHQPPLSFSRRLSSVAFGGGGPPRSLRATAGFANDGECRRRLSIPSSV